LSDGDDLDSSPPADDEVAISYAARFFDAPRPVPTGVGVIAAGEVVQIDEADWVECAGEAPAAAATAGEPAAAATAAEAVGRVATRQTWLVSLDLPIEASSAAEAVRQFWTYVADLGPRELPTFVSPAGDELAIQAMVAGVEVNLDPEEDE
jgi:hypothetical protein